MSDSVANEKNYEQYLEQIETAVAETTKELMSKHNGDLRAMAKVCAEKQVEINRLKEYYNDDKKTIRNLRKQLKEAVEEIECRNSTWETKEKEYEGEIEELNTLIENQKDYIDALPENLKEKEYYLEQAYLDLNATEQGMDRIKKENEKLKEEIRRNDHQACAHLRQIAELKEEKAGICGKYHADFCELEEKREEVKKLKAKEIERVFGVSEEVFKKLLKDSVIDPKDYE